MSTTEVVTTGLWEGKSTSQMIVENPSHNANTIAVLASRFRKELGLQGKIVSGKPIQLTREIHDTFEREALARGLKSANLLALRILTIVAKDDLFEAIIGGVE